MACFFMYVRCVSFSFAAAAAATACILTLTNDCYVHGVDGAGHHQRISTHLQTHNASCKPMPVK